MTVRIVRTRWAVGILAAALWVGAAVMPAGATELRVFSAGAVRTLITEVAEAFQKETGLRVTITTGTVGELRGRLAAGEPGDVVIMTDTAIDQAMAQGVVVAYTRADIARTGVGVGVRAGARRPDISTVAAFRKALLDARSLVYLDPAGGATSGIHFAEVLNKLGITDAVKRKTTLVRTGYAAEVVARGEAELCIHQISEILPVKGVVLVGPLPRELQKLTTYSGGVLAKSESQEAALAFLDHAARVELKPQRAAAGLDYWGE